MNRNFVLALALTFLCPLFLQAQRGTYSTLTMQWNGIERKVTVYSSPNLPAHPLLVLALHGTFSGSQSATPPNICNTQGLSVMADPERLLLVCPIASWKPKGTSGVRFWNSYGTDADFPVAPDDAGFLRAVILQMEQPVSSGGYGASGVFGVIGMSSGGMMAHRLCNESADLVGACAIESGPLYVGATSPAIPLPSQPVSVLMMHGDADTTLYYCGGMFAGWGNGKVSTPSVDTDLNYWLAADGMPVNATPLCSGNFPADTQRLDFRQGSTEVEFVRLGGYGHQFFWWEVSAAFEFFSTHGR